MFGRVDAALLGYAECALDFLSGFGIGQASVEKNLALTWITIGLFKIVILRDLVLLALMGSFYLVAAFAYCAMALSATQRAAFRCSRWQAVCRASLGAWLVSEAIFLVWYPTFGRTLDLIRILAAFVGSYVLIANPGGGHRRPIKGPVVSLRKLFGSRLDEVFG